MRIATLNTWKNEGDYWRRIDQIAAALARLDLDVIALQECFVAPSVNADTAQALARALGLQVSRAPMRRKPRSLDGAEMPSSADLAILTREPPRGVAITPLASDLRDGERLALRVDLAFGDLEMRLINVHLSHLRDPEACQIRLLQARGALAFGQSGWSGPLIVAGDLNDPFNSPALSPLFDASDLDRSSLAHLTQPGQSGTALLASGGIDHVLIFDPLRRLALGAREVIMDAALSDHPVVVARLDLR